MIGDWHPVEATIPAGGTTTNAIDVRGFSALAIDFPATLTGATVKIMSCYGQEAADVAAARNLFQSSGGTPVLNAIAKADGVITFTSDELARMAALGFIVLVSNSAEAAARVFKVMGKRT